MKESVLLRNLSALAEEGPQGVSQLELRAQHQSQTHGERQKGEVLVGVSTMIYDLFHPVRQLYFLHPSRCFILIL